MTGIPSIPRELGHIWIGPAPAPDDWMATWRAHHPDWTYTLHDNDVLRTRRFRTRRQIDVYLDRGSYAGAADLMRYEILLERGGFLAPADSVCYRPVDPLLTEARAYTCYENEMLRGELVSPVLAAEPGNPFLEELVRRLADTDPEALAEPWTTTGNLFVTMAIRELRPEITIFPSYYFVPVHYLGPVYEGPGPVYAKQLFGSTRSSHYGGRTKPPLLTRLRQARKQSLARRRRKREVAARFEIDFSDRGG